MALNIKIVFCFTTLIIFSCSPIFCGHTSLSTQITKVIARNTTKSENILVGIHSSTKSNDSHKSFTKASNISDQNGAQINTGQKNFSMLILYLVIAFFIVLVNVRVFYLVATGKQRKSKAVNIFLAHLASLAIASIFVSFFFALEKSNIFNITLKAPGLCELFSFLRPGLLGAFPLNAVAIIYVRVTSSRNTTGENLLPYRAICLIWLITLVGNLPTAFMVEYTIDPLTQQEECKQIPLLGRYEFTVLYEMFRFLIFHFLECAYMAFVMFQIRSKLRYLYILMPIPNPRMKKKVQRVRYIYIHSIIFILMWLPTGVAAAICRVLSRTGQAKSYAESFISPLLMICMSYFIWSPLIYLILHEDMSQINFFGLSLCRKNINPKNLNGNTDQDEQNIEDPQHRVNDTNQEQNKRENQKRKKRRNELHEATDMSRISTVGESTNAPNQQKNPTEINIPTVNPSATKMPSVVVTLVETVDDSCEVETFLQGFDRQTSV